MGRAHTGMQRWEREGRWGRGGEGGGDRERRRRAKLSVGPPETKWREKPPPPSSLSRAPRRETLWP